MLLGVAGVGNHRLKLFGNARRSTPKPFRNDALQRPPEALRKREAFNAPAMSEVNRALAPPEALRKREAFNLQEGTNCLAVRFPPEALRKREAFNKEAFGMAIWGMIPPEALRKREAFNAFPCPFCCATNSRLKLFGNARRSTWKERTKLTAAIRPPEALRKREAFNGQVFVGVASGRIPPEALRKREAFNIELGDFD